MSYSLCSERVLLPSPSCRIGTFEALNRMIRGGEPPGGSTRVIVWLMAVTWATAASMLVPGWKKTLMTPTPVNDCDSMCSMSFTVVVIARSLIVTMRFAISSGVSPPYCQITTTTGMSMVGNMSFAIFRAESTPRTTMSTAITVKV